MKKQAAKQKWSDVTARSLRARKGFPIGRARVVVCSVQFPEEIKVKRGAELQRVVETFLNDCGEGVISDCGAKADVFRVGGGSFRQDSVAQEGIRKSSRGSKVCLLG